MFKLFFLNVWRGEKYLLFNSVYVLNHKFKVHTTLWEAAASVNMNLYKNQIQHREPGSDSIYNFI